MGKWPRTTCWIREKAAAKKAPVKKLGKIIFEIDGKQIDIKAIEKKAAKLGGDVYVVAAEKKIFDANGKSVNLFWFNNPDWNLKPKEAVS